MFLLFDVLTKCIDYQTPNPKKPRNKTKIFLIKNLLFLDQAKYKNKRISRATLIQFDFQ